MEDPLRGGCPAVTQERTRLTLSLMPTSYLLIKALGTIPVNVSDRQTAEAMMPLSKLPLEVAGHRTHFRTRTSHSLQNQ